MATNVTPPIPIVGPRRHKLLWLALFAAVFFVPAGIGFVMKFMHFVGTMKQGQGASFTILPMVNYLLVAAGFICLLVWAVFRGMFRDVEAPKYSMLEHEAELDNLASTKKGDIT